MSVCCCTLYACAGACHYCKRLAQAGGVDLLCVVPVVSACKCTWRGSKLTCTVPE
jgi:hypothetical protein